MNRNVVLGVLLVVLAGVFVWLMRDFNAGASRSVTSHRTLASDGELPEVARVPDLEDRSAVVVSHARSETGCRLTGRVLDAAGRPRTAGARARTQRHDNGDQPEADGELALTAEGGFQFDISADDLDVRQRTFVVYTRDAAGSEQFSAERELPGPLEVGVLDLGDLTLEPSRTVAAGIALDHHDRPIAGADIYVTVDGRTDQHGSWAPHAKTDAQGRFDIRGRNGMTEIQVAANLDGRASNVVTTLPGRRDLVLRFPAGGSIAGRVLIDEALIRYVTTIDARCIDAADDDPSAKRRAILKQNGDFELRGLRVGTYEVVVSMNRESTARLARFNDVTVVDGLTTRDRRLDPLDLRGHVLSFIVRVVDAHDSYVPDSWLLARRPDGSDEGIESKFGSSTKHEVVCGPAGVDLCAGAPGMCDVEMSAVRFDTTLVLRPGPRVLLKLATLPQLGNPHLFIAAQLEPETRAGRHSPPGRIASFDDNGVARLAANCIGRARVVFTLGYRSDDTQVAMVLETKPLPIDVRDEPGEQTFEIKFEPVDLEAARRRISGG